MSDAGRVASMPSSRTEDPRVQDIARRYLSDAEGDARRALERAIGDALADMVEYERRTRCAERLVSRGFVRGAFDRPAR
jgi:hypothetical protein